MMTLEIHQDTQSIGVMKAKDDQEEHQQWLEDIKNLCAIAIEWMDEALDKINPRVTNPREILDIHEESPLELQKEDDIDEHGSYFMNTSSNPWSHEKSPKSISLSKLPHMRSSTPSYFLYIKTSKGWL